jgi:hypothetical protein
MPVSAQKVGRCFSGLMLALLAPSASAHIAQTPYNLPVPLAMYAYGATGALLASFVMVGLFARATPAALTSRGAAPRTWSSSSRAMRLALQCVAVGALLLSVLTGFVGPPMMDTNFNITFFWIVCLLGYTYLTAIIGDWYPLISPWRALAAWLLPSAKATRSYPAWLGYYPALLWYLLLIWLELFGHASPKTLSYALIAYTVATLVGSWSFGRDEWLRHAEVFEVFYRLVAKVAPIDVRVGPSRVDARLRLPFVGCLTEHPDHPSLIVFVLFMLSSTAFDGIHETVAWVGVFWRELYPALAAVIATGSKQQYLVLVKFYYYWQWSMLFLSPVAYLAVYLAFIKLTQQVTRTSATTLDLARAFCFSLIPIALVYNASHYFTLFVGQAPAIVSMVSDPFGRGWNLFGTRDLSLRDYMFEAGTVWHTQVWLIVVGHIVSVYLSHVEALSVFRDRRQAVVSQIPMLLLMMALTTTGLWILSLPIASGQVMLPTTPNGR